MQYPALALSGLGKDFGSRTAVGHVDLEVVAGECLGLLGNNGAGKTTTLSMACGIMTPTRGTVTIDGIALARNPRAAKARLGVAPQELALYDELSAHANLSFFGALYGLSGATLRSRIASVLELVGLTDRARDPVKQLSGGMKRRLNLAAGLVHEPKLLFLDEPTVGIDPQSRHDIHQLVRQLVAAGTTVVFSSHYLEEVEALCDRVAIMDRGAIVELGTVEELTARHAVGGVELVLAGEPDMLDAAVARAAAFGTSTRDGRTLRVAGVTALAPLIAALEELGVHVTRVEARATSLEAAFFALTGQRLRGDA